MKHLTYNLILPLTILSFATITKWWYTLPVDAPETMYYGFPFPFVGEGWHTSMSLQIFVVEFLVDFLLYFLFWFFLFYGINRVGKTIQPKKILVIFTWSLALFITTTACLIASNSDNRIYTYRSYDMKVMETGIKCIWNETNRPDCYKYHPN